jgi:hypothetical protein
MLNEKNLVPNTERSPSEARENGRKGGIKSGETRRRKKALKSLMNDLLSSDIVNDDIYNSTVDMGFGTDPTYGAAVVAAMVRQAALGDTKAFNAIVDLIGEGSSGERVKLQKKQVELQERKLAGEEEQTPDDGFLSALDGSAAEDWNDEN